jgi:hypothetical protein
MTSLQPDTAEPSTALRVKHRNRTWYNSVGVFVGVIVGGLGTETTATRVGVALTGLLVGAAIGARARPDRCSACGAGLPLRVLDDACPICRRAIVGVEDDGRRTDLPERARGAASTDGSQGATPYRAGSVAARDAAEEALDVATRTDVDSRKRRLREDPAIARALQERDEHALHRIVRARRKKARSIAEEAALDALLADPRRHLEPNKRPWLGVRRGSGLVLADARDQDAEDGSFIAEQLLVVGTYSIVPLASYAVRRREGGAPEILGRVPLPFGKRVWRAVVAAPVALGLALLGVMFVASRSSQVHVINALDLAVSVVADGEAVRLGPGSRQVVRLSKGKHHLVVKDERGALIEEQDIDVPGGDALVAYNVLGVGPIVAREVFYTQSGKAPDALARELFIGRRFLVKEDVTYPFVAAPEKIPGSADLRTWQVTELPGGWRGALGALREQGARFGAVALVEAVSLAEPENADAVTAAMEVIADSDGVDAARVHLNKLSARAPGSAAVRDAQEALGRRPAR